MNLLLATGFWLMAFSVIVALILIGVGGGFLALFMLPVLLAGPVFIVVRVVLAAYRRDGMPSPFASWPFLLVAMALCIGCAALLSAGRPEIVSFLSATIGIFALLVLVVAGVRAVALTLQGRPIAPDAPKHSAIFGPIYESPGAIATSIVVGLLCLGSMLFDLGMFKIGRFSFGFGVPISAILAAAIVFLLIAAAKRLKRPTHVRPA